MGEHRGVRVGRRLAAIAAVVFLAAGLTAGIGSPAVAAPPNTVPPPAANPAVEKACGIDVTLVLDASGSVQSAGAVGSVRTAAHDFLDALKDTNSTARVLQFATLGEELATRQIVDDATFGTGGELRDAVEDYYNPQPQRPSGTTIHRYRGGSPASSGSWSTDNSSIQYTNWQQALDLTASETTNPAELVVFITDGDPTAYDFDRAGDPFPASDVGVGTDSGAANQITLNRSVAAANAVKANQSRVLAVGVGAALQNQSSVDRLTLVSGPDVATDISEFDIETTDVALVPDFDDLAQAIRSLVLELCSPSLTIRKLAQSPGNAEYRPAPGWDLTVTPTVPGGTFTWVLPSGATGPSQTVTTDANGFAPFQWEPSPADAGSTARVTEQVEPGYLAGRPDGPDYRCEFKDADNHTRIVTGEFDQTGGPPGFTLDPINEEIGTCTLWNAYEYEPDIALTKVNSPTAVRGDLTPAPTVTSSYVATNPGIPPLSNVRVVDDKCAPVTPVPLTGPNAGDTNADGRLDPGEQWQFTCSRAAKASGRRAAAATVITNTADVTAIDPAGTPVTAEATDDVEVYIPRIQLTKLVDDQESVTVNNGTEVTYTYQVANAGNTALAPVSLVDDTPPCTAPSRGPDAVGDGDAVLDVDEVWTYSCAATPTTSVVNTAVVTGTPLNPADANNPFPDPNPPVTSIDSASVTLIDPDLTLSKEVDHSVVFSGTTVTYTYRATNEGDAALLNDTGDPGWVTDNECSPVTQVLAGSFNVGDANTDTLLNPDETWQFECSTPITADTVNTATIVAQPVDQNGDPVGDELTRQAYAVVLIVDPGIAITKTALVPVVLDPEAGPFLGPDTPTPRPAQYLYEVANTGDVPLADVDPPDDDYCDAVTYVEGDVEANDVLDVGEVWVYTCETALDREEDANAPPVTGDESGVVRNTATVSGTPFLPDDPTSTGPVQSAEDTASVQVIEPGITLTKTASEAVVLPGQDVTYTVAVTNDGDVGLDLVGPVDDECTDLAYVSGDRAPANGLLDGANSGQPETWTYTCTRAIGLPAPPEVSDTNTAAVIGIDPLGNAYAAEDTADVQVIDPGIALTKAVNAQLVPAGTDVTYTFDVTNAGDSPLPANDVLAQVTLVDVADPPTPSCQSPTLVAKNGGNQDDLLDRVPAETWTYQCTATITERTVDLAVVVALGGSTVLPPDPAGWIPVADFAAANVEVFHPAIEVVKAADPTSLVGGGDVTYTYQVRNTGDVPLAGVAERIGDDTCSPATYVSGDQDGDGLLDTPNSIFEDALDETWIFTCTTTVTEDTTNVVTVTGTPTDPGGEPLCQPPALGRAPSDPCDVSGTDTAVVDVAAPGSITVVKQAAPDTPQAFGFAFGDEPFTLTDGTSRTYDTLAPGQYTVLENASDGWDLAAITCDDPTGDTAVDLTAARAVIILAEGEDVTCTFTNTAEPGPTTPPPPTVTPQPPTVPSAVPPNFAPIANGALPDTGLGLSWQVPALGLGLILLGSSLLLAVHRRRGAQQH